MRHFFALLAKFLPPFWYRRVISTPEELRVNDCNRLTNFCVMPLAVLE